MIACIFHEGSGLGNQLARYLAVRCLALDKGYEFGVIGIENFKGQDFMDIEMTPPGVWDNPIYFNEEKIVNEQGVDIRPYDEKFKDIQDNTIVDGEFQDPKYFEHHLDEIQGWLGTREIMMWDNVCVINFRGGEYIGVKDLLLPKEYWQKAMDEIRVMNKNVKFEVHTDDPEHAAEYFPGCVIKSGIEINWRSIRYAHYLILSNSSFGIVPALLNVKAKKIIAPKYWAGYNVGYWKLPQNQYSKFTYIHHALDN